MSRKDFAGKMTPYVVSSTPRKKINHTSQNCVNSKDMKRGSDVANRHLSGLYVKSSPVLTGCQKPSGEMTLEFCRQLSIRKIRREIETRNICCRLDSVDIFRGRGPLVCVVCTNGAHTTHTHFLTTADDGSIYDARTIRGTHTGLMVRTHTTNDDCSNYDAMNLNLII